MGAAQIETQTHKKSSASTHLCKKEKEKNCSETVLQCNAMQSLNCFAAQQWPWPLPFSSPTVTGHCPGPRGSSCLVREGSRFVAGVVGDSEKEGRGDEGARGS